MGWASSADYMQGTSLKFKSKEDAVHFCEKQGAFGSFALLDLASSEEREADAISIQDGITLFKSPKPLVLDQRATQQTTTTTQRSSASTTPSNLWFLVMCGFPQAGNT